MASLAARQQKKIKTCKARKESTHARTHKEPVHTRMPFCVCFLLVASQALRCKYQYPTGNRPHASGPTQRWVVRITYENDPRVPQLLRVQLMSKLTNPCWLRVLLDDSGRSVPQCEFGPYRLVVTGTDIEEARSETAFSVDARESVHSEYIRIRKKQQTETAVALRSQWPDLNIPDKARKEFEKAWSRSTGRR